MNYVILRRLGRDDVQEAFGPIWGLPTTFLIGRDGKVCTEAHGAGDEGRSSRRGSSGSCSMIASVALKGFVHARLACGCVLSFREGVEGSPVTVVLDLKSPGVPGVVARSGLPLYDYREAIRMPTRLLPPQRRRFRGRELRPGQARRTPGQDSGRRFPGGPFCVSAADFMRPDSCSARRSRNSICAFRLRRSSSAQRCSASCSAGIEPEQERLPFGHGRAYW